MFRRTDFWLIEDDLRAFAARVASVLPAAWWMCSRPGPYGLQQVHAHRELGEALHCGGGEQAFLPLPAGAEPPAGALVGSGVQVERGLGVSAMVTLRPTVRRAADLFGPGHLQAGHVSVRWNPAQDRLDVLQEQTDQVWAALDELTVPALGDGRIGRMTRERVAAEQLLLSLGVQERFSLPEEAGSALDEGP
ncbi:hypothetical protein Kisp01_36180 [Kineosporia sp. NBRC 101677]|uniref:hypothetical protein n=1 Tax=Kineosporia sp. NBRC 101677 TaxID=3032197 RepID=UPI00249FE971|nr:hypothetical protein [Kineosporia sp. NBRC 101677]GLY16603.1 hypothetical protein Kisp01_36180 [Kineosporia sp. NBRC 101677]